MSAAQLTILGINAAKPFLDNSEYWHRKGKRTVERIRRKSVSKVYGEDPDADADEDPRDSRESRPRGGFIAASGRSKSTGNYTDYSSDEDYYRRRNDRGRDRRRSDYRNSYDAYESEGSVPPRSRGAVVRRNNNTNVGAYDAANGADNRNGARNGSKSENNRDNDDDSEDSILSSDEDKHQEKKKQREKLITGGIATIATLNAAANVYNSMKQREARLKALADGTITKEDAKKERYKHHLQDAAAIGVSAICVKGAYAKWQQTTEKHREHRNHRQERMERREKRLQREARARTRSEASYDDDDDDNNTPAYANGDAVQAQRPGYARTYSRSVDDFRAPNYNYQQYPQYQYPNYNRSSGRRRNTGANRGGDYDYANYDAGGYGDGDA